MSTTTITCRALAERLLALPDPDAPLIVADPIYGHLMNVTGVYAAGPGGTGQPAAQLAVADDYDYDEGPTPATSDADLVRLDADTVAAAGFDPGLRDVAHGGDWTATTLAQAIADRDQDRP